MITKADNIIHKVCKTGHLLQHGSLVTAQLIYEVYFTSELPKTNVGKILRRKIKEAHVEQNGAGTSES
jgi:acyl-coenzyme A synthetase/AMP-(fatty) acid ligase